MRKTLISLAILAVVGGLAIFAPHKDRHTAFARLGGETLALEVADTNALRVQGLSGRATLSREAGMLFVFDHDERYGFWMKDMQFPIDIVWLDYDYRIVDVKEGATPASYPEVLTPKSPARYVLELSAGFFANHRLREGDTLEMLK